MLNHPLQGRGGHIALLFGPMSRSQLFAWTFALGCVNGLSSRAIEMVREVGWSTAVLSTFEVSAIVWIACVGGISLLLRDVGDQIRGADIVVVGALLVPIALPIGGLSWLAIALLSLYIILLTNPPSARRRGAMILLAVTVPMLWSRLLFRYFAPFILDIDASLISLLLGTPRTANLVQIRGRLGNSRNFALLLFFAQCFVGRFDMGGH